MTSLRRSFRKWWQPPRRLSEREEERSVTFLELFCDLVYVVLISQLAHSLSTPLLVVLILLLLAPVFYGLKVWIEMLGAQEIPLT